MSDSCRVARNTHPTLNHVLLSIGLVGVLFFWRSPGAQAQDADIEDRLVVALSDSSFKVRLQAAILIGKKQLTTAAPSLRKVLHDEHDTVSAAAAMTLGKLGHQPARSDLCTLLAHVNPLVSQAAEKALGLLDQDRGPVRALINTVPTSLSAGVNQALGRRLDRLLREKLDKRPTLVLSAGEENVLSGAKLASHLRSRNLVGYQLQPRISALKSSPRARKTIFVCRVDIIVASLEQQRMEYSASGEASAEIADPTVDEREDLIHTLLDAAADAALDEIVAYVGRRGAL